MDYIVILVIRFVYWVITRPRWAINEVKSDITVMKMQFKISTKAGVTYFITTLTRYIGCLMLSIGGTLVTIEIIKLIIEFIRSFL